MTADRSWLRSAVQLWHDPHPSRDGLLAVEEAFVLRPPPAAGHDHDPTPQEDQ